MHSCSTPWIWLLLWDGLLRCRQQRDGLPDPTEWCTFIACTVTGNSTLPTVLLPRFDNKHGIHKCSKLFLLVCWNGRPGFFNYEYFIRSYYCNVLLQYSSIPLWSAQGVSNATKGNATKDTASCWILACLTTFQGHTYGVNRLSILDKAPCFDIIMSVPAGWHHACYLWGCAGAPLQESSDLLHKEERVLHP